MRPFAVLLVAAVIAIGCSTVTVPNTPEGQSCVRECMIVRNTCNASCRRDDYGCPTSCAVQQKNCWRTCPGATEE